MKLKNEFSLEKFNSCNVSKMIPTSGRGFDEEEVESFITLSYCSLFIFLLCSGELDLIKFPSSLDREEKTV